MDEAIVDPAAAVAALSALGGVATRAAVVAATSRRAVDCALASRLLVRVRRGCYGLPVITDAAAIARAAGGLLCLESAVLHHGWPVKTVPERPHVLVARGRTIPRDFESPSQAANPFESVLRAICLDVPGLDVRPQVLITSVTPWARPDLVDPTHRVVIEADSFEWHGDRAALRRDAKRYNLLVVDGWLVSRFAWEDVMFDQSYVQSVLEGIVRLVPGSTEVRCPRCGVA